MTPKIEKFFHDNQPDTPCLVVDVDVVEKNYHRVSKTLAPADVFYAVKVNPAEPVLKRLAALGAGFDAASIAEVEQCLAAGADPARISFGNTIKKSRDIAKAFEKGVRVFAFDSVGELDKLADCAPGSKVFCRILIPNTGARWPLSRKFGCEPEMARDLLRRARDKGLKPYGLSFHVGSQQLEIAQWELAIAKSAIVFHELESDGISLKLLNLGGGFPARYREDIQPITRYAEVIHDAMIRHFGNTLPEMMVEPGRAIVADAGVLRSEVVLVSTKSYKDDVRWIYLDVGRFGGLAETLGEAIQYTLRTNKNGGETGPVIIAGPTCDGLDVLYEDAAYELPLSLKPGDTIDFLSAGAYTTTYAASGFNGFAPPAEYYI